MRIPGWMMVAGVLALTVATGLCSVFSYSVARQVAIDAGEAGVQVASFADFLGAQPSVMPTSPVVTAVPAAGASLEPTASAPTPTLDPASDFQITDPRSFTVLVLGIDQRSATNEPGPFRTDTMILISIDPVRKSAGVLSIPRDLWVTIPGFQPGRINTANSLGDANGYPGGGPALAARTVEENLGLTVDKYVLVNFEVFTTAVNTLAPEGVEVCIEEMIDDPHYPDAAYGTIQVHFDPGCQVLDAERLLQYARTRATFGGDFDRAARQQHVLRVLRDKMLSAGGVSTFIGQAPTLWDQLSSNVRTNMTLEEIISIGVLAQDIPQENIRFGVLDNLYVDLAMTSTGDNVLVPRHNAVRFLLQQVFNPPENLTLSDLRARAEAEEATIVVYNNTDISGLASQMRDWLTSQGVNVSNVGNIPTITNSNTMIRDYTGSPWTARYLAALLGLAPDRIEPGGDGLTTADVMVVIGPDVQPLLSGEEP